MTNHSLEILKIKKNEAKGKLFYSFKKRKIEAGIHGLKRIGPRTNERSMDPWIEELHSACLARLRSATLRLI